MDTNISTEQTKIKVSIVLPTYNGERFLARAIESVCAQVYTSWELLIIDDGSVDGTEQIVQTFAAHDSRIRYYKNEHNLGIQKTLNEGLRRAQGKYIARIDDDDYWIDTQKLAAQVSFLENHPEYVLVGTNAQVVDVDEQVVSINAMSETDEALRSVILGKNCFLHATVMFQKEHAIQGGGYNESQDTRHVEDYELWLRLGTKGKFANLSLISTALTAHTTSITAKNRVLQARRMLGVMKRYDRQYPRYVRGRIISTMRFAFFRIVSVIPIPKKVIYLVQRLYR